MDWNRANSPPKLGGEFARFQSMRTFIDCLQFGQNLACCLTYILDRYSVHATMVDRTFSQQTWATLDRTSNDSSPRSQRACDALIGRTEDRDGWNSQGSRDVHRSGIICDHQR